MADPGSIDDFLSSEIDENAVNALVGSLETQLATPASTQASKTLADTTYNNNHLGRTTSTSSSSSSVRPLFLTNQTVILNQKGSVSNNSSLNTHSPASNPKLSSAEILGISSIINSSSTPVCGGGVSHVNVNTSIGSNGRTDGQKISAPTIRIVTQSSSTPVSSTNTAHFISSSGGVISQTTVPTGATNNVHAVHVSNMGAVTRTNATAASSTIYNLANTIAAEQKPMTVVHNGSAHPIQVAKDRAVLSQQGFIVKQDGSTTLAMKQDGTHQNQQFIVKQEGGAQVRIKPDPAAVVSVAHSGTLVNTTLKGVAGVSNPSIITVRTHPHPQQVTVVQQPTVVTTQANMTQPMHVVNVSGTQGAPRLANVAPSVRPGMRVTTPVRITQPNIAPRQTGLAGTNNPVALPHGTILVRNEHGQLMIVQTAASHAQHASTAIHPANVITTTSVPITSSTGLKIQRPVTTATLPRPGGGTIVIQPGGQARGQPVTLTQSQAPRVISQATPTMPAPSIAQPQPAIVTTPNIAAVPELNKMMMENVKKCKNFLSTLLKLAASQPASTVKNVRDLIQGLIDSKVEPEDFTQKLQHELSSSPQPYLVPFLKKSLPMLRQSMQLNRMGIDGIRPPPHEVIITTSLSTQTTTPTTVTVLRPHITSSQPTANVRPPLTTHPAPKQPKSFQGASPSLSVAQKVTVPGNSTLAPLKTSVVAASSLVQTKPAMPQATIRPSLSNLGPASSKVLMQAARPSASPAPVKSKGAASPAVTAALQAHAQKSDTAVSTGTHKEKRKFEVLKDDNDDINDVATMGGVNLSEESKNILATNSELIGSQIRSCQDKTFLPQDLLMNHIAAVAKKHGLEGVSPDVARVVSHATQDRLRDLISKLSSIAEHRMEIYKVDPRYEVSSETRSQLKFIEELDKVEKKRHEEQEREKLLRAIKSRSKNEDPEQLKLKQKAKELQQAEAEVVRQREANQTALAAIGPRKKRKLDNGDSALAGSSGSSTLANGPSASSNRQSVIGRPRFKRVTNRDLQFLMEDDILLCKSPLLYRTFLR